jgi:hypothetical protein
MQSGLSHSHPSDLVLFLLLMSLSSPSWSWSEPAVVSILSHATRLAAAKERQARLVRKWCRDREETLARVDQILAETDVPADELLAEQIRTTAPLGKLLQASTGLG